MALKLVEYFLLVLQNLRLLTVKIVKMLKFLSMDHGSEKVDQDWLKGIKKASANV